MTELLKYGITPNQYQSREGKVFSIIEKLGQKLMKNECILDDKKELREIQIYSIYFLMNRLIANNKNYIYMINFYQIINFFRDIDFCLKLLVFCIYSNFNNKNHIFIDELHSSLFASDIRYTIYNGYGNNLVNHYNELNVEDQKKINDSLSIKDFIIIGNKQFQESIKTIENKIKAIENKIKAKSLQYLQIEQISNYIKEKNKKDIIKDNKLIVYFYYLIIRFEEFQKKCR